MLKTYSSDGIRQEGFGILKDSKLVRLTGIDVSGVANTAFPR